MYLLAVFTLLIALTGVYAQVVSLQAARMASGMKSFGETMLEWNAGAVSMAASIINTNLAGYTPLMTTGCSLTYSIPAGASLAQCPAPSGLTAGTVTTDSPTLSLNLILNKTGHTECAHLPSVCTAPGGGNCSACGTAYDIDKAQFYSVLYRDVATSQDLVITFLPPPTITASNPKPGFLTMARGNVSNIPAGTLMHQLSVAGLPKFSYGYIQYAAGNKLVVSGNVYNLPLTLPNLDGGIGIISTADGF